MSQNYSNLPHQTMKPRSISVGEGILVKIKYAMFIISNIFNLDSTSRNFHVEDHTLNSQEKVNEIDTQKTQLNNKRPLSSFLKKNVRFIVQLDFIE